MVNDAERYFFEAQQAIPNFRRSGRLCQQIISCEIINGNYSVARKLLHELSHSLFYSRWADERLAMLGNEKKINADPSTDDCVSSVFQKIISSPILRWTRCSDSSIPTAIRTVMPMSTLWLTSLCSAI